MWKKIILGVCVAIIALIIVITLQPGEFRVTRSATIAASVPLVFEQVNDLEKGQAWSPWVEMDPNADYKFEGPKSGVGAVLHWNGEQSGKGTMTIIDSQVNTLVKSRLEFFEPMVATNTAEFSLEAQGENTKLTWTMYGPNSFIGKAMGLVMNCDKMVGDQFEKGLSNLKQVLEIKK